MSFILNSIKEVVAKSIQVEVKSPITRNGHLVYPTIVTDMSESFTRGWYIRYNPVLQENGTRLYDSSQTFMDLHITRFSEAYNLIQTANYYFLQGNGVDTLSDGRHRAIYEPNDAVRLTVTSQKNSVSVTVTITDESSPFYMMSIPFTVVQSNTGDGSYYIVGTEDNWDRNTDTLQEFNANFAPRKSRFYRVHQTRNQAPTLRAKIAVSNGNYAINHDGTFQVDINASRPEYIQVITNEYKALAFIYERAVMEKAFEMALKQGLPQVTKQDQGTIQMNPEVFTQVNQFVPAFTLQQAGQPKPANNNKEMVGVPVGTSVNNTQMVADPLPWETQ